MIIPNHPKENMLGKTHILFLFLVSSLPFLIGCSNIHLPQSRISIDQISVTPLEVTINQRGLHYGILPSTGSMLPALPSGSTVLFHNDVEDVRVGDIVQADNGICAVTHRIYSINNGSYILKGDNNPIPDPCLYAQEDIKSIIVGVIY